MEATTIQFILLGASGAGKTAVVERFIQPSSTPSPSETIGINVISSMYLTRHKLYRTKFWDTSGSEHYDKLYISYIFNCDVALIVFDTTSRASWSRVEHWVDIVKATNGNDAYMCIIGNKVDQESKRQVYAVDVKGFIRDQKLTNIIYSECSAMTGENTRETLELLVNFSNKPVREVFTSKNFHRPSSGSGCNIV